MADCELLATCLFFTDKMAKMPKTAHMVKGRYCRGKNTDCARHMVFVALGREKVPLDLFPGQTDEAQEIISNKK